MEGQGSGKERTPEEWHLGRSLVIGNDPERAGRSCWLLLQGYKMYRRILFLVYFVSLNFSISVIR